MTEFVEEREVIMRLVSPVTQKFFTKHGIEQITCNDVRRVALDVAKNVLDFVALHPPSIGVVVEEERGQADHHNEGEQ